MTERFTDDLVLVDDISKVPVHTVGTLRRVLGVIDADIDATLVEIRGWLASHTASDSLVRSISRSEYAAALDVLQPSA